MNIPAPTSPELAELNELLDGMKQEMGMFGPFCLTRRRDEEEELPFNCDSASPLLPSHAHSSSEDEEVMLNFWNENQADSTAEASERVRVMPPN